MKLRSTQKLVVEDFPEQREWIAPLFRVVNDFITDVVGAINGSIIFSENITGVERTFDFTYVSTTLPLEFKWTLPDKPTALQVCSATEAGSPIIALASWEFTEEGNVSIANLVKITGSTLAALTSGTRYKVKFRATP
jgi:hypothetical protein